MDKTHSSGKVRKAFELNGKGNHSAPEIKVSQYFLDSNTLSENVSYMFKRPGNYEDTRHYPNLDFNNIKFTSTPISQHLNASSSKTSLEDLSCKQLSQSKVQSNFKKLCEPNSLSFSPRRQHFQTSLYSNVYKPIDSVDHHILVKNTVNALVEDIDGCENVYQVADNSRSEKPLETSCRRHTVCGAKDLDPANLNVRTVFCSS